ncbi:uncharacterized protein N7482_002870 [Penicillium canariense]|uniref:Ribonucleases P/MRP subunit Pop8-like domain-containing protein n=1 Tax=Penicillium canariense TaxID=189055 RepID=A0A9W9IG05_9EURO|nr:uncharacterized protein N7482_002870 [Penicillium canariense]KAJ5176993.1 hypothetical protein N7482_002870 [Penicillium canariense]
MADVQHKDPVEDAASSTAPKRKAPDSPSSTINFTSRNPPWTYLKLQLVSQPDATPSQPLDALSARTYLSSALSQFLGLTGTAIPIDILKVETGSLSTTKGASKHDGVWVRVPRDDGAAVVAALSSWIGGSGSGASAAWRVCAKGNYLGALVSGSGSDLFVP